MYKFVPESYHVITRAEIAGFLKLYAPDKKWCPCPRMISSGLEIYSLLNFLDRLVCMITTCLVMEI